jgi:hypothetical protein
MSAPPPAAFVAKIGEKSTGRDILAGIKMLYLLVKHEKIMRKKFKKVGGGASETEKGVVIL